MDIGGDPHFRGLSNAQVSASESDGVPQGAGGLEKPAVGSGIKTKPDAGWRQSSANFEK